MRYNHTTWENNGISTKARKDFFSNSAMEISIPVWVEIKENKYPYQVDKLLEKQW